MRKLLLAGAIAATSIGTAASAAVVVTYPNGQTVTLTTNDGVTYSGQFRAAVDGFVPSGDPSFSATFNFNVPASGRVSIAAISIATSAASNIDFTSSFLDGTTPFTISNGAVDTAVVSSILLSPGAHSFTLSGLLNTPSGIGNAGFGGDISFTLGQGVPEPTSWALFILGFGMIGGTMRRHTARARSVRAQLTLA